VLLKKRRVAPTPARPESISAENHAQWHPAPPAPPTAPPAERALRRFLRESLARHVLFQHATGAQWKLLLDSIYDVRGSGETRWSGDCGDCVYAVESGTFHALVSRRRTGAARPGQPPHTARCAR
jgi:hypothetical protein